MQPSLCLQARRNASAISARHRQLSRTPELRTRLHAGRQHSSLAANLRWKCSRGMLGCSLMTGYLGSGKRAACSRRHEQRVTPVVGCALGQ